MKLPIFVLSFAIISVTQENNYIRLVYKLWTLLCFSSILASCFFIIIRYDKLCSLILKNAYTCT